MTLELTVTVEYQDNQVPESDLANMLTSGVMHLFSAGFITGETAAEVSAWDAVVRRIETLEVDG